MIQFFDDGMKVVKLYLANLWNPAIEWYFALSAIALAGLSYLYFTPSFVSRSAKAINMNYLLDTARALFAFAKHLFPRDIYLCQSTKTDLLYMLSFPLIAGTLFKPALTFATAGIAYSTTHTLLAFLLGESTSFVPDSQLVGFLLTAAFTVISAMAADFGFFLHHYLLHKVPFLWEFHKVHHSAEVLTPLTDFRAHPLEILTVSQAKGIGLGVAQGIFNYSTGDFIEVSTVLGMNAVFCLYYALAYPLRHSHIWISYGTIVNHLFVSPALHQIHHSTAPEHLDKNFGGFFAIWDWMFGTLYVPNTREELTVGLSNTDTEKYQSFWRLYVLPFQTNSHSKLGITLALVLILIFSYFAFMAFATNGFNIL